MNILLFEKPYISTDVETGKIHHSTKDFNSLYSILNNGINLPAEYNEKGKEIKYSKHKPRAARFSTKNTRNDSAAIDDSIPQHLVRYGDADYVNSFK